MAGKSRSVLLLLCLCSIVLALNSTVQSLSDLAAAAQSDSSYRIRVDVDLATIEVAVLDKRATPYPISKKKISSFMKTGKNRKFSALMK